MVGVPAQPRSPLAQALAPALNEQVSPLQPLDWLDKSFLAGLRGAENLGFGGTQMKLYNDVIQRGRKDPITEKDFTPQEIYGLSNLVNKKIYQTGEPQGAIDYPDYRNSGVDSNLLGGFRYSTDPDGKIKITDKYDFNTSKASSLDQSTLYRLLNSAFHPVGMGAIIGRKIAPPGSGVDVKLNLGQP